MVASGFFPDATAVSPVRLVIHLALALLLYGAILWTALSVLPPHARRRRAPGAAARRRWGAACWWGSPSWPAASWPG